ncbi:M42 family metallopeptidase [Fuchsiella alkaliacetigena]|uniref:M42 family metallopeptidase n=1 Tax=Fuchsiella alkaliacetigena TaxID=957042 RepID=UPI002009F143|nr:M42 family metallopeptidase [Fuchsiella alkaliacetigena]MCK8823753.1 M42 family metallopeptidase [Fuchsiella alkaliacetigena]
MLLGELADAMGVSGAEYEVRDLIKEKLADKVDELRTDTLGNLIAYQAGDPALPTLLLSAHMDEVGLMVTKIEKNGLLSFKKVGGIDSRVLASKRVFVGTDKVPGVIGTKAIHLQKPKQRKKAIKAKQLYIDIGAKKRKEAKQLVSIGDTATFATQFSQLGAETVKGKAFDDRVGCAILMNILEKDYDFPLYGVFSVQEEIGLRGARVAAYDMEPDLALVIEGTTAADVPDSEEAQYSTTVGAGPALTVMDRTIISNKQLIKRIVEIAEKEELDYQFRRSTAAGTDAGKIHLLKDGIPTAVVSVPVRYIHSPVSLLSLADYRATEKLVHQFCCSLEKEGFEIERVN